jgi:hypothetical protein
MYFTSSVFEAWHVPFIDRRFSLVEVPEALRYLGEGFVKGKVVIIVELNNQS